MMGLCTAVAHTIDRSGNSGHWAACFWSRFMLFTSGVRLDVQGGEDTPRHGRLLIVSNHRSMLDIPVLIVSLPVSFRFMAKLSLFRTPFIGWHLSLGGHIPVEREDKRAALKAFAAARRKMENGAPMLLFPEGSRSPSGLRPFKPGAALLALKAKATIVPVGVSGTGEALPRGTIQVRPAHVRVRIGKPIPAGRFTEANALTAELQRRVAELIAEPGRGTA